MNGKYRGLSGKTWTRVLIVLIAVLIGAIAVTIAVTMSIAPSSGDQDGQNQNQNQKRAAGQQGPEDGASVPVRASVDDYSWDELARIADEISSSGSAQAALQVAEAYHLVGADGILTGGEVKTIELSDGTTAKAQIVGFYQDDAADGSGKAGITFMTREAVSTQVMYPSSSKSVTGKGPSWVGVALSWKNSALRTWLASDFPSMLPDALVDDVVTVDKLTDNAALDSTVGASASATEDAFWVPSTVELTGSPAAVLPALDYQKGEGSEYQLYRDLAAQGTTSAQALMKDAGGQAARWWTRSFDAGGFDSIGLAGEVDRSTVPDDPAVCVVVGFCL